MYVISRNAAVPGVVTASWLSALSGVVRHRYSDWAVRRREMAARAPYYATDMELRDMGMNRGDISASIRGNYCRD